MASISSSPTMYIACSRFRSVVLLDAPGSGDFERTNPGPSDRAIGVYGRAPTARFSDVWEADGYAIVGHGGVQPIDGVSDMLSQTQQTGKAV